MTEKFYITAATSGNFDTQSNVARLIYKPNLSGAKSPVKRLIELVCITGEATHD